MVSLLVCMDEIQTDLSVIQAILGEARKFDLFDEMRGAMSDNLVLAVNIALRKAVGKRKLDDTTRYKILAELCGLEYPWFDTTGKMGKSAAMEFIAWVYGKRDIDLSSNPPVTEQAALVIGHLYDSFVAVLA